MKTNDERYAMDDLGFYILLTAVGLFLFACLVGLMVLL